MTIYDRVHCDGDINCVDGYDDFDDDIKVTETGEGAVIK
jgi:hypothetical protein